MKQRRVHPMQCPLGEGITLWGRSRAADSTSFVVPELGFQFDAGAIISSAKPTSIFITHTHADHCFRVTHLTSRQVVPTFFVPAGLEPLVMKFVAAGAQLSGNTETLDWEKNCELRGVSDGESFLLQKPKNIRVRVASMDHSVATVGYGISRVRNKLRDEFKHLSGAEIAKVRKEQEVSEEVEERLFFFCGDTTPAVFARSEWILSYPAVVCECSFLFDEDEKKAAASKHTLWRDLLPVILAHPNTRFILIHFSMRYDKQTIRNFFARDEIPGNVEIMLQEDDDDTGSTFGTTFKKEV
jgi:ribonuclease Z